jgi:site-specific DNA recombinase
MARRRSLLTGLLRCGVCRAKLTRTSTPRGRDSDGKVNERRTVWRCWTDKRGCGAVSIVAEPLEAVVIEALFEYGDGDELRAALAHRDDGRVQAIRADLTALDVRRRALVKAFTDDGDPDVLRIASDALDGQRKQLEAELGAASARSPLEGYRDAPGALRAAWPAMTTDQQRTALEVAFGTVTVAPATAMGRIFDPTRISFGSEVASTAGG